MVIKKVCEIEGIDRQSAFYGFIYSNASGQLFRHISGSTFKKIAEEARIFVVDSDAVYFQNKSYSDFHCLNLESGNKQTAKGGVGLSSDMVSDEHIYVIDRNDAGNFHSLVSKHSMEVSVSTPFDDSPEGFRGRVLAAKGRLLFGLKASSVFSTKNLSPNFLWQAQLPEGEKTTGNMQIYQDVLIVRTQIGGMPNDRYYLNGYNLHTGELLWRIDWSFYDPLLDENTGIMHIFGCGSTGVNEARKPDSLYKVVNALTGEIIAKKSIQECNDDGRLYVNMTGVKLYGDGLYFVSRGNGEREDNALGKLNIHTHEIDFIQREGVPTGVDLSKPVVHNDYIYVVDSNNTLHIYEKSAAKQSDEGPVKPVAAVQKSHPENKLEKLTDEEFERIKTMPVIMLYLAGMADSAIEPQQLIAFGDALQDPALLQNPLFNAVAKRLPEEMPSILEVVTAEDYEKVPELLTLKCILDKKVNAPEALVFMQALISVGQRVAEASSHVAQNNNTLGKEAQAILEGVASMFDL